MLRIILSAVALAGVLASAHHDHAEHQIAVASANSRPALPINRQFAPVAPAASALSPDAPALAGSRGDIVPVGFGWG